MLLKLFIEFFKIGAFSFGGGFATLPHLFELSDKTGWFNYSEVNNMITISQMTPGPLACNMATYIGFKMQGICGAILTSISFVIPAILFMYVISKAFQKFKDNTAAVEVLNFIRASTFASILISCLSVLKNTFFNTEYQINLKALILAIIVFSILKRKKIHPLIGMSVAGIIGIVFKFNI